MIQRFISAVMNSKLLHAALIATLISLPIAGLKTAGAGAARPGGDVVQVRLGGDTNQTRIVIELEKSVAGKLISAQDDHSQTIIALPGIAFKGPMSGAGRGLISGWQLENVGTGTRLKIAHKGEGVVYRRFLLPPADGISVYRYVVDIIPASQANKAPVPTVSAPVLRASEAVEQPTRNRKKIIVIDAGHGGKDPGALGSMSREKDINLRAALALKKELERTGRYTVIMIRADDRFVDLPERVRIARSANADLFISLHSNSAQSPNARGASIYTLSESGSERAARKAMTRGDWALADAPGDAMVQRILMDLTQRSTKNRSATFAQIVMDNIEGTMPLEKSNLREAGFVVLLAPDVPAVLLEMGFMTNKDDERLLNDNRHMNKMMGQVARAIDKYFDSNLTYASFGGR